MHVAFGALIGNERKFDRLIRRSVRDQFHRFPGFAAFLLKPGIKITQLSDGAVAGVIFADDAKLPPFIKIVDSKTIHTVRWANDGERFQALAAWPYGYIAQAEMVTDTALAIPAHGMPSTDEELEQEMEQHFRAAAE
jgi:hypothetical protein